MLEHTKKPHTSGHASICIRVPLEDKESVKAFLRSNGYTITEEERTYTPEEVLGEITPGRVLRGARYREDMTQATLAEKIGASRHHISEMENNKRPIGKKMAKRLAEVLNTNYRNFL